MRNVNPWRDEGIREGMREGMLKGMHKGKFEGKLEVARNMLAHSIPIKKIAAITGLPLSKIEELQKQ